jgi:hypothetical protein
MTTYAKEIESPTGTSYYGTVEAEVYEVLEPGQFSSTQLIRDTQDWGIQVRWEMHDAWATFLNVDFEVTAFAESIGPGPEANLGTVTVNSLSVPFVGGQRVYGTAPVVQIPVVAGTLPVGAYQLVVILQPRYVNLTMKLPFAGLVEVKPVSIFSPV